jgi:MoxR-like ATPase
MSETKLDTKYVENKLIKNNYIPDENIINVVLLSIALKKPILIEGPPGTGKTELSKAISKAFERNFFRIQCYEGITFEQIVGEWNYQKQLLHLEMSKLNEKHDTEKDIFNNEFFIKRPLLSAFINNKPSIILIDEIDKADEEVESFLLQALGEKQITINDLGTFDLKNDLIVILTSNSQRQLLDETKDRCLYLYIDYPSYERELEIVKSQIPNASPDLIKLVVNAMQKIRTMNLTKTPSIRGTIDWVKSLVMFDKTVLDEDSIKKTINVIIKNENDKNIVLESTLKD